MKGRLDNVIWKAGGGELQWSGLCWLTIPRMWGEISWASRRYLAWLGSQSCWFYAHTSPHSCPRWNLNNNQGTKWLKLANRFLILLLDFLFGFLTTNNCGVWDWDRWRFLRRKYPQKSNYSTSIKDATQTGGSSSSLTNRFWKKIELYICKSWPGLYRNFV